MSAHLRSAWTPLKRGAHMKGVILLELIMKDKTQNPYEAPKSLSKVKGRSKIGISIVILFCLFAVREVLLNYGAMVEYSKPWTNIWVIHLSLIIFYAINIFAFYLSNRLAFISILLGIAGLVPMLIVIFSKGYGLSYLYPKELGSLFILITLVIAECKFKSRDLK